eukprot:144835-Prymnesium_polylepis.1
MEAGQSTHFLWNSFHALPLSYPQRPLGRAAGRAGAQTTTKSIEAICSRAELSTLQRQNDDIDSLLNRLSSVTGIPVPPHCRPRAVATSPQCSPASPIYSDSAPPSPS